MQVTKDSYILSRNVIRVNNKTNKFYNFIKRNRFIIVAIGVFWGLVIIEMILLNQFYTEERQKIMPIIAQELLNTSLYKTIPAMKEEKSKRKILSTKSPK